MEKTESRDLYLRTIYCLSQELHKVRNIDIAIAIGYSKPSVTNALKKLCADELISLDKEDGVLLTEQGAVLARKAAERETVLAAYFLKLGLNEEGAYKNAQRIGNQITDELFELIRVKTADENMVKVRRSKKDLTL